MFAYRGICCKGNDSTYQIVVGHSESLKDQYLNKEDESWVDNNYSLFLTGDQDEPGRGHNGFFTENDTTFIVFHAYMRSADGASLLNIKLLYMDEGGWHSLEQFLIPHIKSLEYILFLNKYNYD